MFLRCRLLWRGSFAPAGLRNSPKIPAIVEDFASASRSSGSKLPRHSQYLYRLTVIRSSGVFFAPAFRQISPGSAWATGRPENRVIVHREQARSHRVLCSPQIHCGSEPARDEASPVTPKIGRSTSYSPH
ncbi:hypothetical protein EB795_01430 [Pseudomonas mandelii]|nr:hypothetical protein [Pseudomonas mandelii]